MLFFSVAMFAQNVHIPDANFKKALVEHYPKIDTNGDGEIQVSEAESYTRHVTVYKKGVTDVTGIEAFINIESFSCDYNNISSIDISKNTKLKRFSCWDNNISSIDVSNNLLLESIGVTNNTQISSIDVSKNTKLSKLYIYNLSLTELDVTNNPELVDLDMDYNKVEELDLSNNPKLSFLSIEHNKIKTIDFSNNLELTIVSMQGNLFTELDVSANQELLILTCGGNLFTELDFSQNSKLIHISSVGNSKLEKLNVANGNNNLEKMQVWAYENPKLFCIQVDSNFTSNEKWRKDDQASYNINDCKTASVEENITENVTVFPNPTTATLEISGIETPQELTVFSIVGKQVLQAKNTKTIDLSVLNKGVYLLKIKTDKGQTTQKIIKS